jgi:modification methylase
LAQGYDDDDDALPYDDYRAWQQQILAACWHRLTDDGAIFYVHKPRVINGVLTTPLDLVPDGVVLRQIVIWSRAGGVNFSPVHYLPTHEWILVLARPSFRLRSRRASGVGDVWTIPQVMHSWHPAPFPLALAERVLETTAKPLVCDPFVGSGTTAVAARRQGLAFLGCDRHADYIERAMQWVESVTPMPRLWDETEMEQETLFASETPDATDPRASNQGGDA